VGGRAAGVAGVSGGGVHGVSEEVGVEGRPQMAGVHASNAVAWIGKKAAKAPIDPVTKAWIAGYDGGFSYRAFRALALGLGPRRDA
jgi:hypothetical protein